MLMIDDPKYITGTQIRAARTLLNWTQADLARAAHISVKAVGAAERGSIAEGCETAVGPVIAAMQGVGVVFISDEDIYGTLLWQKKPADIIRLH